MPLVQDFFRVNGTLNAEPTGVFRAAGTQWHALSAGDKRNHVCEAGKGTWHAKQVRQNARGPLFSDPVRVLYHLEM